MTSFDRASIDVLGDGLSEVRIRELMRNRSAFVRLREIVGRQVEPVQIEREIYWPIALIHATAESTGRRRFTERVMGAVDLISGRVGQVDVELAEPREVLARWADCLPPQVPRGVAELRWHEFFRDLVDRRHKPLRPPTIAIDRIQQVWLPNSLVSIGRRRYLVDSMTARVDELAAFPSVEQLLTDRDNTPTKGELTCRA